MWWCGSIRVYEYICIVLYSMVYNSVCRYGIYSVYSMYRTVQCIVYVLYAIVYISVCQICDDVWLNEAKHIWHIDRVTEQWQTFKRVSIYDSLPVCQIIKQLAIRCCLLLSRICALFLCLLSVIWGVAFYYVAVNVLYCLYEHIYYLYDALTSAVVFGDSVILF